MTSEESTSSTVSIVEQPDNAGTQQTQQDATTSTSSSVATPVPQPTTQPASYQPQHQQYIPSHHVQHHHHHHQPHHVHHPMSPYHGVPVPVHHPIHQYPGIVGTPMVPIVGGGYQPSQLTSLYVGDLAMDVNEIILNELFSKVGHNAIASIHVCRDSNTMRSLGYAYVNFFNNHDAERALDTLNYSMIHGKPCRIMWSYRDPTKRKTNVGNVFVKNLEKGVDNAMLYDTFSSFGSILSCKVEFEKGVSKGYGYVHFETNDSAEKAIEKVNGSLILGKPIAVERFVPKVERYKVENKVFFRNADESVTVEMIQQELSRFGEIESCTLKSDINGKSKGLGLIEFKNQEDAQKLLAEVSTLVDGTTTTGGIEVGGKPITIDRIKSKVERFTEYRKKTTDLSLFINNIDESVDRELIKEEFAKNGTIIGIKIVQDENGKNKGFGFISFSDVSEATKAVETLNGFTFGSKQIQVSFSNKDHQVNNKIPSSSSPLTHKVSHKSNIKYTSTPITSYLPINPRYHHPHQIYNPQQQQYANGYQQAQINSNNTNNIAVANNSRYPKSNGVKFNKSQNTNGIPNKSTTNSTIPTSGYRNSKRIPNGKPRYNNNNNTVATTSTTEETTTAVENTISESTTVTTTTLTLEFITNATPEEATEAIGSEIYNLVLAKFDSNLAAKITGMIINAAEPKDLFDIISNGQIQSKIDEAKLLLDQHVEQEESSATADTTITV